MPAEPILEEIAFHRRVVSGIKKEIAQVDRHTTRRYIRDFHEEFRDFDALSSLDDLIIDCFRADIIYIGDYHALPASQRFAATLLREITARSRRVILAVEMVYGRNQRVLDDWMGGVIGDAEFRRRIRYDLEWGYEWEGFRGVFETARDYGVKVFGIDCPPRNGLRHIRRRDRYAAARLVDLLERHPDAKCVVMIGESHLASGHLPARVREALARRNLEKRSVRVLQNLEEVYWKLARQGDQAADVVTIDPGVYCVFNASPIAKYESYRQTINRWKAEEGEDQLDLTPTIYNMIDTILQFLRVDKYTHRTRTDGEGLRVLVDEFPDVYSCLDRGALRDLLRSEVFSEAERAEVRRRIRRKGSCYLPRVNAILIGELSLVHGGEEAAHFVNFALRGDVGTVEEGLASQADLFYGSVMEEAIGFFGSKLIDPSRNHFFETKLYEYHRKDPEFIEKNTEYSYRQFRSIIDFILLHKRFEREYEEADEIPEAIRRGIRTRNRKMASILTHELGYFLGQQIYDGYQQGVIDRAFLRDLFTRRFGEPGSALKAYLDLVEILPRTGG